MSAAPIPDAPPRKRTPIPRSTAPGLNEAGWDMVERWVGDWYATHRVTYIDGDNHPTVQAAVLFKTPETVRAIWLQDGRLRQAIFHPETDADSIEDRTDRALLDLLTKTDHQKNAWVQNWTIGSTLAHIYEYLHVTFQPFRGKNLIEFCVPDWTEMRLGPLHKAEAALKHACGNTKSNQLERVIARYQEPCGVLHHYLSIRLRQAVRGASVRAFRRFYAQIDRRIWSALAKAHLYDIECLTWLLEPAPGSPPRLYRCQALERYAGFTWILVKNAAAIDQGLDPSRIIADHYGVKLSSVHLFQNRSNHRAKTPENTLIPDEFIRHLQGKPLAEEAIMTALDQIPVDWLPKQSTDWRAIATTIARTNDVNDDVNGASLPFYLLRTRDKNGYVPVTDEVRDFLSAITAGFLLPLAWRCREDHAIRLGLPSEFDRLISHPHRLEHPWQTEPFHHLLPFLIGDRHLRQTEPLALAWHNRLDTINRAMTNLASLQSGQSGPKKPLNWPVPARWTDPVTGIRIIPLETPDALADEGRIMKHCVGNYVSVCLAGRSVILSLVGEERSTAELTIQRGQFCIAQHKAVSNGEPPHTHEAALIRFIKAEISTGKAQRLAQDLKAQEKRAALEDPTQATRLAFDPRDDQACTAIFELWRFAIPHRSRYTDWRDWATASGIAALVTKDLHGQNTAIRPIEDQPEFDRPISRCPHRLLRGAFSVRADPPE